MKIVCVFICLVVSAILCNSFTLKQNTRSFIVKKCTSLSRASTLRLKSQFGNEFGSREPSKQVTTTNQELNTPEPNNNEASEEEKKRELSDMMKQKMRREAQSLGGDPNAKSSNPILLIAGAVALLAVLSFATGAIQ